VIYVNYIYKGAVVQTLELPMYCTDRNIECVKKMVNEKRLCVPENYERYEVCDSKPETVWRG
jgi:hypothetical protein